MISVLLCVFNQKKFFLASLYSVINQDFAPTEIIIVDDASTDWDYRAAVHHAEQLNRHIKFHFIRNESNLGLTRSLNIGLDFCSGEYIARQDADDISLPNRFDRFREMLFRYPSFDLYSTPYIEIDKIGRMNGKFPKPWVRSGFRPALLRYHNPLCHGSLIIRRNLLSELRYDERYLFSQDFDLYIRSLDYGANFFYDSDFFGYLDRRHDNRISIARKIDQLSFFQRRREKIFFFQDLFPLLDRLVIHLYYLYNAIFRQRRY